MDLKKLSDQELLQHCLDSQEEASWTEFVRRFQRVIAGVIHKALFRWMHRYPDQSLVEDLVQETFTKLCAKNRKALRDFDFRDEHALHKFLKVVASRIVEDYVRRRKSDKHGGGREEVDLDKVSVFVPANPGSPPTAETATRIGEVERCLAQRAGEPNYPRDSAIFWLHYRQGMTAKEIAALPSIGLSVKGVESTLLRLTRYVRERLGPPRPKPPRPPMPPRKRGTAGG
jgi:RNA polymerase sigma factor (sigma-70 family)